MHISRAGYFKLLNFVLFQFVWLLCVIGQEKTLALAIFLIVIHFNFSTQRRLDACILLLVASSGVAMDLVLTAFGVFSFDGVFFPLWLVVLWCAFSLTFGHSLAWVSRCPIAAQAVLGALGGASSYFAGYLLGAVSFGFSETFTMIIVGFCWALIFPGYFYFIGRMTMHEQI